VSLSLLIALFGIVFFVISRQRTATNLILLLLLLEWFFIQLYGDWANRQALAVTPELSFWSNSVFNLFTIALTVAYVLTVVTDFIVLPESGALAYRWATRAAAACGIGTLLLVLLASLFR